jgi:ferrous iron transport protein A
MIGATDEAAPPLRLTELPVGTPAVITEIRGGRQLTRRLLGLGLRLGSTLLVLHHRGAGVVLAHGETRLALGGGVVDKIWVRRLDQAG